MPYYINNKIIDNTNICEYLQLLSIFGVIPKYNNIYNDVNLLNITINYSGGWGDGGMVKIEYNNCTKIWTSYLYNKSISDIYNYLFTSGKATPMNDKYLDYVIISDSLDDILEPSLGSFDHRHYEKYPDINMRNIIIDNNIQKIDDNIQKIDDNIQKINDNKQKIDDNIQKIDDNIELNKWIPKNEIYNLNNIKKKLLKTNSKILELEKNIDLLKKSFDSKSKTIDSFLIIELSNFTVELNLLKRQQKILSEKNTCENTFENTYEKYVSDANDFLIKNKLYNIISVKDILSTEKLSTIFLKLLSDLTKKHHVERGYYHHLKQLKTDYDKDDLNDFIMFDKFFGIKQYIKKESTTYETVARHAITIQYNLK
jgi:hypothetical protein